jgi:cell division protease FtsH
MRNQILFLLLACSGFVNGFWKNPCKRISFAIFTQKKSYHPNQRYIEQMRERKREDQNTTTYFPYRKNKDNFYETLLKRLHSKNGQERDEAILGQSKEYEEDEEDEEEEDEKERGPQLKIILRKESDFFSALGIVFPNPEFNPLQEDEPVYKSQRNVNKNQKKSSYTKTENFELVKESGVSFKDVGGYENVKSELQQCVDLLQNYQKYAQYNVRVPKGLILEGPPGTGKTLLAKAFAGEAQCSFISVAGSDFQEKYVGVGPTRIKELFRLAKENEPCVIFIDEIDALGRKRSSDGETSSNERDNTLNALLVELDGFKNMSGVFIVCATNRVDLLDNALTRPGRIDKKIYIGLPDKKTREAIIRIHIHKKPHDSTIQQNTLVEITEGMSGAEIENVLNEAMLYALRQNNTYFTFADFDLIMNKMMAGWQPTEHEFTTNIIDHIAIHEMGHAIVGYFSKHHSKLSKVVINLSSPKTPGYTVFESSASNIYVREALFEHLMILLSGRIAEEVFYNVSVTTGALNDFEEALKLAERMVLYYGMGNTLIYPSHSEKYKECIDNDVVEIIDEAYKLAHFIIVTCKELIYETSEIIKREKLLKAEQLDMLILDKYHHLLHLMNE